MVKSIFGQIVKPIRLADANTPFDWMVDSLATLHTEIVVKSPHIDDRLGTEPILETAGDGDVALKADKGDPDLDLDKRSSDDASAHFDWVVEGLPFVKTANSAGGDPLALASGATSTVEGAVALDDDDTTDLVYSDGGMSWPDEDGPSASGELVLDGGQEVHFSEPNSGGLGMGPEFHGTEGDDVFFEIAAPEDHSGDEFHFSNRMYGYGGNDTFYATNFIGWNDDDGFYTDSHIDEFNGGNGIDTVSYQASVVGVFVNLEKEMGFRFGQKWWFERYNADDLPPGTTQREKDDFNRSISEFDRLISIENVTGTQQDDIIRGDDRHNVLSGLGGNDSMWGGFGEDTMYGGSGSDDMRGESGHDEMYGGTGNDRLWGEYGDDEMHGGADSDTMFGGEGDDLIYGDGGNDRLYGQEDWDTIWGGDGDDHIEGGDGNDELHGEGGENEIYGGWGQDLITLGDGGAAWGGQGHDVIHGGSSRDFIYGGAHNDTVFGWDGNDELSGGTGDDSIYGGNGVDMASYAGTAGAVQVYLSGWGGASGYSTGAAGEDELYDIEGIVGSSFDDVLAGDNGNNNLVGGHGDDALYGNGGLDLLNGGNGDDTMSGGLGDDYMIGGNGDDELRGGLGVDNLTGGNGADDFVFYGNDGGVDTISDFELGTDRIVFNNFLADDLSLGDDYTSYVFAAAADQEEDSDLWARTEDGWVHFATLDNVSVGAADDAISDGSLFHLFQGLDEALGGYAPVEGDFLPIVTQDDDYLVFA